MTEPLPAVSSLVSLASGLLVDRKRCNACRVVMPISKQVPVAEYAPSRHQLILADKLFLGTVVLDHGHRTTMSRSSEFASTAVLQLQS